MHLDGGRGRSFRGSSSTVTGVGFTCVLTFMSLSLRRHYMRPFSSCMRQYKTKHLIPHATVIKIGGASIYVWCSHDVFYRSI